MLECDVVLVAIPVMQRVTCGNSFLSWEQMRRQSGESSWVWHYLDEQLHAPLLCVMERRETSEKDGDTGRSTTGMYRFCAKRALAYLLCKYRRWLDMKRNGDDDDRDDNDDGDAKMEALEWIAEWVGECWAVHLASLLGVHGWKPWRGVSSAADEVHSSNDDLYRNREVVKAFFGRGTKRKSKE